MGLIEATENKLFAIYLLSVSHWLCGNNGLRIIFGPAELFEATCALKGSRTASDSSFPFFSRLAFLCFYGC